MLTTYLIKKFIPAMVAELQFHPFTTKAVIPEGAGNIGRFNVFSNPPGTVGTVNETTTQNEINTLTTAGTDVTIAEYGEFLKVSKLMSLTATKTSVDELSRRMAYAGAFCVDKLIRTQAALSTTAFYAETGQRGGSTTLPTGNPFSCSATAIMGAAKVLRSATVDGVIVGAQGFTGISGHENGHFAAIISPLQELQIVTESTTTRITWKDCVTNVPGAMGQEKAIKGYVGPIYGTTVYRTQNYATLTVTSSCDVGYVMGEGAIGAVSLTDMQPTIVYNDVNSPYKNMDSIAWHFFFGTKLIDSTRIVKMYSNNTI
jgi:N4-gp56 family major capsid protein